MALERLDAIRKRLREEAVARGANPQDVDVLLADWIGESTAYVVAHGEIETDPTPVEWTVQRRWAGEPLQYIRQRAYFFGREFFVDDRVLIPRPETELLVEAAVKLATANANVIDVGSGSGAIAISLALERPDVRMTAIDASFAALAVTALNCRRLEANVRLAASDVLTGVRGQFDLIVSNPPYIPASDVDALQVEVRDHEPKMALTPGRAGTEMIDRLLDEAKARLAAHGRLIFEIGFGQSEAVRALAAGHDFAVDDVFADLAGIPRTVVLSRHGQ